MTRYSPGGGAGTCPLVPGSRASTTLGGEGCHSLAATPRETASSTLARCRPPRPPRPPEWCLGWPAASPDAAWWLLQGWCASRGRGGGGVNAPPPSLSKRMCCRGRVGWCWLSRALGLVNRFIPERDASPRQERISAERAPGRFSMPCGAAAMVGWRDEVLTLDRKFIACSRRNVLPAAQLVLELHLASGLPTER